MNRIKEKDLKMSHELKKKKKKLKKYIKFSCLRHLLNNLIWPKVVNT